ncbi:MAG: tRNA (N6-threonylcarbamoyladenosine(37)-N6)-methyltransferase TrmO [Paludibacteraceae bacterium]|nr:tRNA (N6-threonylcarbamoyladenosine(37)-N6)-methyltransferase TrmO [Paludibacteraceae bacterium]
MELQVIAYARNGFSQKFGIPRQSREESCIETHIIFAPAYRVREALRGIEDYSHLWLLWGFSQSEQFKGERPKLKDDGLDWSPTVRPPRLGGNKRIGVFATRSPFRPNPIGLTSVKLLRVEDTKEEGVVLVVSGADLLDGTPIYDIKPYLTFSDSHPNAKSGFAEATQNYHLEVQVNEELLREALKDGCPWNAIKEILSQDPRPAYQNDSKRVYHVDYADWEVSFIVEIATVCIKNIARKSEN